MAASRGGLVVFAVGGGVLALGLAFAVFFAARAWMSAGSTAPAASTTLPGARADRGSGAAGEGMHAPGTAELRRLGCDPAIVMDMLRLLGDARIIRSDEPRYIITCDVAGTDAPTCDRAAGTYFASLGAGADGNVNVRVAARGAKQPSCSQLYAPSGANLGAYPRPN